MLPTIWMSVNQSCFEVVLTERDKVLQLVQYLMFDADRWAVKNIGNWLIRPLWKAVFC